MTPEEALKNEQITARGMVLQEDGLTQFAPPLKMSDGTFATRRPAPAAGEHNDELLLAAGYSREDLARLTALGAFG